MAQPVRIGNAQAFWGDRGDAAAEMLSLEPELDYLTMDYLAEVSMSILALQRERDPQAGYARDFVDVVRSLAGYWSSGGQCRLIVNAGGLNPQACAEACRVALEEAGCRSLRIGIVTGDNVLPRMKTAATDGSTSEFQNLDSGAALGEVADRLVTANAYLGADAIVQALAGGADIVITGRVADPSLVVAACRHHFGWSDSQLDELAGATVAGHLIECGTQVTGGISTDWLNVPDGAHIGFPIVEVAEDGSCLVTKPEASGGHVTEMTVKEQLVYEIGDPANYLSPDVAVSFQSLQVSAAGNDRVQVTGAKGRRRPDTYKVSATFRDGFRAAGMLTIVGREAVRKARRCGNYVLQRVQDAGFDLRKSIVECLGAGDLTAGINAGCSSDRSGREPFETVLRVAVEADSRAAVERFARELMPLITAGPQGTTGYAEGRPRVHPVFRYWPCLIERDAVTLKVEFIEVAGSARQSGGAAHSNKPVTSGRSASATGPITPSSSEPPSTLYEIACARSGDKGVNANIGVIARNPAAWDFLQAWLTAERVRTFLAPLGAKTVARFELPTIQSLNFVLHDILNSLRTDAQGKTPGQILLEMPLPEDAVRTMSEDGSLPGGS